jgi:hypothetical protein
MASSINATKPTTGSPTTQSVRDNFSAAKDEINGLLRSSLDVVTTTGTGTAYSANFSNNVVKTEGARIIVKAHTASTGAATLNVDGTGASTILTTDGANLSAGQIAGNNHYLDLVYNSANNSWVLLNPKGLIAQLDTARLITLANDVTGSTFFDGSQNITITAQVDKLLPYPVGAIYTSVVSTNPSSLFGGTWVAFAAGRVLVGINSSDGDFNQSQETGGAKTVTLTAAQSGLPAHSHTQRGGGFNGSVGIEPGSNLYSNLGSTGTTGGQSASQAHNNLQPYIVVYMWKRTN